MARALGRLLLVLFRLLHQVLVFLRMAGPVDAVIGQTNQQQRPYDDDAVKQNFFK